MNVKNSCVGFLGRRRFRIGSFCAARAPARCTRGDRVFDIAILIRQLNVDSDHTF